MSSLVPTILLFSWIKVPVQMICTFMPSCWKVWQDATEIEKWQELQKLIRTPYMTLHWLLPWTIWVKMSWGTSYCFFTLKITFTFTFIFHRRKFKKLFISRWSKVNFENKGKCAGLECSWTSSYFLSARHVNSSFHWMALNSVVSSIQHLV